MKWRCRKYGRFMISEIYGELPAHRLRQLERHLSSCQSCRVEYQALKSTVNAIRDHSVQYNPPSVLDQKIISEANNHVNKPTVHRNWFLYPMPATAAVVIVVIGFYALFTGRNKLPAELSSQSNKVEESTLKSKDFSPEGSVMESPKGKELSGKEESKAVNLYFYDEKKPAPEPAPKKQIEKRASAPSQPAVNLDFSMSYRFVDFDQDKDAPLSIGSMDGSVIEMESGRIEPAEVKEKTSHQPGAAPAITQPVVLKKVEPAFPEFARQRYPGGSVVVEAVITKEGKIGKLKIVKGLDSLCDEAAVNALEKWEFEPGKLNGNPIETKLVLTVTFQND